MDVELADVESERQFQALAHHRIREGKDRNAETGHNNGTHGR